MDFELIKKELSKLNTNRGESRDKLIKFWAMEKGISTSEIPDQMYALINYPERFSQNQLTEILMAIVLYDEKKEV